MIALVTMIPSPGFCQSGMFRGMRYLGEIGHLETDDDHRTSADLVIAKAISVNQHIHIEGTDDRGKRWTAAVRIEGGMGWTDAWIADFDGNSRRDLLIAWIFPPNGRCLDPVHLTFLMMDSAGRPVPWSIDSRWPRAIGEGKRPALLVDFNRNGWAELVDTSCESSPGPEVAEDRRMEGIYEAKDAHWQPIRPPDMRPYAALFRANYRATRFVHVLPPKEADSTNLGNEPAAGAGTLTLTAVQPPTPECSEPHIWLPPMVNGRLDMSARNPCDELRYARLVFSDGSTCYADTGMTIVLDRTEGREIVEMEKRDLGDLLHRLVTPRLKIIPIGQTMPGKCSPVMLWATEQ